MLERKRKNKHYDIVPGEEPAEDDEERDVELGTVGDQDTGSVPIDANGSAAQADAGAKNTNVTEELDNWDEHAEDWDDEPATADGKVADIADESDAKKRVD